MRISGLNVFGDSQQLVRLARTLAIDEIIVAITHAHTIQPALFEAILDCRELGIPITNMSTIYERLTGRVAVEYASQNIETATGSEQNSFVRVYYPAKRLVDMGSALIGLVVMLLLSPIVLLANALTSPGPLFYRQQRVGRGGRPFIVRKFRSMIPNAEEDSGAVWAKVKDDRVTPIGRLLRATHLDELPQATNVLRGEMSLVGPRPERPEFVGELSRQIVFYRARHCMRPGITGWAQIHQNYGDSVERAREKLEYDLYYVKHASFFLDSIIMLRTIMKVLGLRGR
jgi:exopolysaccharide biosynthesis polyprenyl glycosylphosphotransferase